MITMRSPGGATILWFIVSCKYAHTDTLALALLPLSHSFSHFLVVARSFALQAHYPCELTIRDNILTPRSFLLSTIKE